MKVTFFFLILRNGYKIRIRETYIYGLYRTRVKYIGNYRFQGWKGETDVSVL